MKPVWDGTCHLLEHITEDNKIIDLHTYGLTDDIGMELQYVINPDIDIIDEKVILLRQVMQELFYNKLSLDYSVPFTLDDYKDTLFQLFITTDSRGKEICRIIESDNNKKFPTDKTCLYPYNMQYKNIYQLGG